jgi:hypothetical protein
MTDLMPFFSKTVKTILSNFKKCFWWQNTNRGLWPTCSPHLNLSNYSHLWDMLKENSVYSIMFMLMVRKKHSGRSVFNITSKLHCWINVFVRQMWCMSLHPSIPFPATLHNVVKNLVLTVIHSAATANWNSRYHCATYCHAKVPVKWLMISVT